MSRARQPLIVPPEDHLLLKRAMMTEQRRPQVYLLFDEVEARAMAATRAEALADIRRQARAVLHWFEEV